MYYANERGSGKIIPASKASVYGSYQCPTCRVEVFLRRGRHRVAHFAHWPGQGKDECEDFHPSDNLQSRWTTPAAKPAILSIDPLLLSIELEPEYDSRYGARKWGLRLTVPKPPNECGVISIDLGGGRMSKISLAKLSHGAQSYRADTACSEFGAIWVSPDVHPQYRAAVEHRIPGLTNQTISAFSATRFKLKPRTNMLRWGESYYFVWRAESSLTFPLSTSLQMLAENSGWACALVVLPDRPDTQLAVWLEQVCDLQIARATREWAMIYPQPYALDDDGALKVADAAMFLIAIQPANGARNVESEVLCHAGQASGSRKLSGPGPHLIEIVVGGNELSQPLHLSLDGKILASLIVAPIAEPSDEPNVALLFSDDSQRITTHHLHGSACRTMLGKVREGVVRLSDVRGAFGLYGEIRWRRSGEIAWHNEVLTLQGGRADFAGVSASLPVEQVARIEVVLRDPTSEVILDFGPFGSFSAPATQPEVASRSVRNVRRDMRQRIEWVCKASGAFVVADHGPVGSLDDDELLRHFSRITVPLGLRAHHRTLLRALAFHKALLS